jgi:hypothetical protein
VGLGAGAATERSHIIDGVEVVCPAYTVYGKVYIVLHNLDMEIALEVQCLFILKYTFEEIPSKRSK